jgi:hypothetical protein
MSAIEIVTVSSDPASPMAGLPFVLNVELNSPAPRDLTIVFEKQRLVANAGGTPQLLPTGPSYFLTFSRTN